MINIFNRSQSKAFIIAEAGVNHENSFKNAIKLIDLASKGGADAIKFQTYKAEKLASIYSPAYWDLKKEKTKNQYSLFKKYDHFNKSDYEALAKHCKKRRIGFLSTPFDEESVDFLSPLVKFFKISSSDITNHRLINKIASKKKPIILSTGASNIKEIKEAVQIIKKWKVNKICIMHCILNYPTSKKDANLLMIKHIANKFNNFSIGFSDHTLPDKEWNVLSTAYSLGATVIEKHFTLNKYKKGNDHYHSMDYMDLKRLRKKLDNINIIIGKSKEKYCIESEKKSKKYARRSIVAKRDIKKGEKISFDNTECKRPGTGIPPSKFTLIKNKIVKKNIKKDMVILEKFLRN